MRSSTYMILVAVGTLAACETPAVTFVRPEVDDSGAARQLVVHVTLEDSATAEALGWADGVPGASVIIHRFIEPFMPDTLVTDGGGLAPLGARLPGWHMIAGHRILTVDESAALGGVLRAFGDGVKVEFPPSDTIRLRLLMDQPGSLVISEIFFGGGTFEIPYGWDRFFELHSNADTTVYVDGMVLGRSYSQVGRRQPCEDHRAYREDPLALWSAVLHQFPGTGRDYPVAPGQTITIALDAVDHSQVHPSLPDLSSADFEFEGTADTDNPDVPNMPELSPRPDLGGHGMQTIPSAAHFLAGPVTVSELARRLINDVEYIAIPSDRIVDVVSTWWASDTSEPPFPLDEYCTWVNREFDRLESPWYRPGADNRTSQHRRILRQSSDGRLILHDANTSFTDFVLAVYSPGSIAY